MDKYLRLINNESIFYREFGKGETVVLVPSMWVTSTSYSELGKKLGKYYRVLIPDIYRGKSTFPNIATSIDEYASKLDEFIHLMDIQSYYLIGVSLSGFTITKFVQTYTNKPKKLFLISTSVLPLGVKYQFGVLFLGYLKLLYHNIFSIDGWLINWLWIKDGLYYFRLHARQMWKEGKIAGTLDVKQISSMPIPTKLIFALKDEFIPQETVGRLKRVKNLEVEEIDGYHGWFFHHEEKLTKKIVQFFRS
jgi:pimeloyl-ACP methyl ester carboxylesterase